MSPPAPNELACDGSVRDGAIGVGVVGVVDGVDVDVALVAGRGDALAAECAALACALARSAHATAPVEIRSDCRPLLELVTRSTLTTVTTLSTTIAALRATLAARPEVSLRWVPRHENGAANLRARAALGLPDKAPRHLREPRRRRRR